MKEYFKYMIIGFFIPYILAWLFVFMFGLDTPDNYTQESKGLLIGCMAIFSLFGILVKLIKDTDNIY